MTSQLIVRLDSELKVRLQRLAQTEGKTTSQVVRELIETYIQERDLKGFVDTLWNRIGSRLESHDIGPEDIERAIRDVRAGKR